MQSLYDQMRDNNKKARKRYGKDNIIPPSTTKNKGTNNGIPMLISSDGINKPVVDPNILSTDGMDAALSASMAESLEDITHDEIVDILRANADHLRSRSNDLFNNLHYDVEWDASSELVHILIQLNDNLDIDAMKGDDNLYPYPLDITIISDLGPIIIMNSETSIDKPDEGTEGSARNVVDEFDLSTWIDDNDAGDDKLTSVLYDQLHNFDDALSKYVNKSDNDSEVVTESLDTDLLSDMVLVMSSYTDDGDEIEWYMSDDMVSYMVMNNEVVAMYDDYNDAQDYMNQYEY